MIGRAEDKILSSGYHERMWNCVCDCGTERVVRGKSLRGGISKSCGCYRDELAGNRNRKHGGFGTRLYAVWNSMRQRCLNPKHPAYHNYGARGILICKEWDDFDAFRKWAYQSGYQDDAERGEFTLDRIDVNAGYSPENCRWADMREQAHNRRDSIVIQYDGSEKSLKDLANEFGIDYTTAWRRYKNGSCVADIIRK